MTVAGFSSRPAYYAYRFFWLAVDSLFPPACGGCGRRGQRWCRGCQASITRIVSSICPHCGEPTQNNLACQRCRENPPAYRALRSCAEFGGPLREALHRLKYQRDLGLGEALGRLLVEQIGTMGWKVDLIVPIPLGRKRMKERGYNQADLLARPLALATGSQYSTRAVRRERETVTQVGLGVRERLENVSGAFLAEKQLVSDRTVLVVDDVATTGATISACASALTAAGASGVYGLTLARAVFHPKSEPLEAAR
jgi:competence protein ComFC